MPEHMTAAPVYLMLLHFSTTRTLILCTEQPEHSYLSLAGSRNFSISAVGLDLVECSLRHQTIYLKTYFTVDVFGNKCISVATDIHYTCTRILSGKSFHELDFSLLRSNFSIQWSILLQKQKQRYICNGKKCPLLRLYCSSCRMLKFYI